MPKVTSTIRVPELSGGMSLNKNKFLINDNAPVYLKNVTSKILGSWTKRNGYSQYGDTLQTDKTITGLHSQVLNNGTKRLLATVNDSGDSAGVLKYYNSGTWTTISGTSLVADAKTEFANWLNQVFIVGYDSTNGYNTIKELSNLTVGTTNLTSAPNAKYAIEYLDQLYLGNIQISGSQYPSYLAYSSVPTLAGAITWDPTITGMLGVGISDGDEITGLAKGYGQLLIFKNKGTYIFNGSSMYKSSNYGTISNRSIRNIGQNVFAFHWDTSRKSITIYNGEGIISISKPIDAILKNVTSANAINSVAGTKDGHYYLFVGDITIDEDYSEYHKIPSTITNCLIDLDFNNSTTQNPIYSIHSLPISVKCMAEYDGELYFGSSNGEVYLWDSGYSDDETPIEWAVYTKMYYGTDPDVLKDFQQVIIYMNKKITAKAFYSIDNGDWVELGDCNKDFNVFTGFFGSGHGMRLKITGYGSDGNSIVDGFQIVFNPKGAVK